MYACAYRHYFTYLLAFRGRCVACGRGKTEEEMHAIA